MEIEQNWLAWNQDNVSGWRDMSTPDCCFSELALSNSTKSAGLVQGGPYHYLTENLLVLAMT